VLLPTYIDFSRQSATFTDAGGGEERLALPADAAKLAEEFKAVEIDYRSDLLTLHLPAGGTVVAELGLQDPDDVGGRPVVYLDQNQWSTLAAVHFGLRDVPAETANAARRMLALGTSGEIVLPISAGHAIETGPQFSHRRVALATTMLEGSRGWQMRHPVRVRAVEFDRVVGDGRLAGTEHAVFTRTPDVLWTRRLYPGPSIPIPPLDRLFPRLTDLASYAATMRNPDALADQRNASDGWIAQWTRISEFLEREQAGADRTYEVTFGAVLADLAEDLLLRAPVEQLTRWFDESARTDVAAMPYMSRTMWVMFARLRNVKAGRKCTPQRRSKMHPLRACGRERGEVRRAERSEWPRARSSRWGAVSTLFAGLRPRSARPAAI
jgi:hypothetical protein